MIEIPIRHRLPDRRPSIRERLIWRDGNGNEHEFDCSAGIDPIHNRVAEVFITGHKSGSAMQATMNHAAIWASIAMQCGLPAAYLARAIASEEGVGPASPIATMADFAARIDAELKGEPTC